ncbi:MAG: hypothetical protein ACK462_04665, partial [Planctomyces sp.]
MCGIAGIYRVSATPIASRDAMSDHAEPAMNKRDLDEMTAGRDGACTESALAVGAAMDDRAIERVEPVIGDGPGSRGVIAHRIAGCDGRGGNAIDARDAAHGDSVPRGIGGRGAARWRR